MKQGATTISTYPGTLPLIEVGDNDRGCVVRFGRVALRLTAEPGGVVRVTIFGEKAHKWSGGDLIIVAQDVAPDAWRKGTASR